MVVTDYIPLSPWHIILYVLNREIGELMNIFIPLPSKIEKKAFNVWSKNDKILLNQITHIDKQTDSWTFQIPAFVHQITMILQVFGKKKSNSYI